MRRWLASMRWRRLAIGFGLLLIAVSLGSSLRKALERVDAFPEHRGYSVPAARFIHFSIENVGETAPWYSAMAQARNAQAMMWGHRLRGEPEYLASLDPETAEIASGYSFEGMSMVRRLIVYYWNRWAKTLDRYGLPEPCVR